MHEAGVEVVCISCRTNILHAHVDPTTVQGRDQLHTRPSMKIFRHVNTLKNKTIIALYGSTCTSRLYPVWSGLVTMPCHALVDTGAQDGVIGLWSWQRWVVCLGLCQGLRPVYQPVARDCEAGGVGGSARPLMIAYMPTGIAGANTPATRQGSSGSRGNGSLSRCLRASPAHAIEAAPTAPQTQGQLR